MHLYFVQKVVIKHDMKIRWETSTKSYLNPVPLAEFAYG